MNVDGIDSRTNWPNTGEITVNEAGAVAGVSACDGCADVQSRPTATATENGPGTEFMAVRFAGLSLAQASTARASSVKTRFDGWARREMRLCPPCNLRRVRTRRCPCAAAFP